MDIPPNEWRDDSEIYKEISGMFSSEEFKSLIKKFGVGSVFEKVSNSWAVLKLKNEISTKFQQYYDVVFIVENQQVFANKKLLVVCSEYFRAKISFYEVNKKFFPMWICRTKSQAHNYSKFTFKKFLIMHFLQSLNI